jgi:hypothetical protein
MAAKKKKKPAAKKPSAMARYEAAEDIMVECDECSGHGEVQAACTSCNISLTTFNVEPGTDDLCRACAKDENA